MRTVSLRLADLCDKARVPLGRVGDNLHTQVRIDCLKLFEEYPSATAALTVRPPKGDPYPAVIVRDGDIIVWNVTDSDLIYPGTGEAQLVFTAGDVVAHRAPFKTMVERSIVPTGTVPDPVTNWIEEAEEVLEDVRDAIPEGGTTNQVLAKASNDDYDLKWVDQSGGGGGTSDYEELDNLPQIGGVTLKGNKTLHDLGAAAEGDIPDVSGFYTKPSGGIPDTDLASGVQTSLGKADSAYQKPAGGIPASDMASGVIPVLTDLIDDTAGDGDTNKVWSADKSSILLTEITNTEDTVKKLDLIDFVARDHLTISGYYLTSTGKKTDNSSYSISPFIPVKQGTTIKFGLYASSFMSVFAYYTTNEEGQSASYVKAGTGTAGFTEGEYTAPGNGYIRFCSNHTKSGEYLYFDNIKSDMDRVTSGAIATEVTGIKQKTDQITLENTYEYTQLADFGRENTSNTYTTYHQIDETDGSYISTQYSSQRACETYFEIPSGCVIFNYLTNQGYTAAKVRYCFYDTNKTYLGADKVFKVSSSNVHDATYAGKLGTWVTYPSNAKYVRIWDESGNFHALALSVATITNTRITNFINKHLDGKKILAFGDSIWGNDRYNGIADFLAEYSGATVYNGAVGGTRITDLRTTDSPAYLPFDGVKLVHALMTNTWTDQDENASSVISYVETQTLPMLKALDVSTIDIITLAYGHNDITANETVAQVQTALDTIIHDILSHYPSIRILVITPPWRMFSSDTVDGDDYTNSQSVTLRTLADGLISEATAKHIASLDMLGNAPICADTKDTYMDSDHVHLNETGNALYAHIVNGKLKTMY